MAYRFNGTTDLVEFAIAPFTGTVFGPGPGTFACYLKRTTTATNDYIVSFMTSATSDLIIFYVTSADILRMFRGANASGPTVNNTSTWYLLAATWNTTSVRFHVHDGTSWAHSAGSGSLSGSITIAGTDRLAVGAKANATNPTAGDIVCAGIKKADSTDLQIETLSRTAFSAWTGFGFDWLIGFDTSLTSAGVLQDQGTPGTGDQIAISGTSVVADPPGWSWATGATFVPRIIIS